MVAYIASTVFYTTEYILLDNEQYFYAMKVSECTLTILSGVLPITYVLHIHAGTYSKIIQQQNGTFPININSRVKTHHQTTIPLSNFDLATAYEGSAPSDGNRLSSGSSNLQPPRNSIELHSDGSDRPSLLDVVLKSSSERTKD